MKILLLGYGKMGKAIEGIALSRNHNIVEKITEENVSRLYEIRKEEVDVVIEFSTPEAAAGNISTCLNKGWAVVSGTTGWLSQKREIESICKEKKGAFFYASNFSIGVNIFFRVNKFLAQLANQADYAVQLKEIHHIHKKDAPSGTALTLAEGIISENKTVEGWTLAPDEKENFLTITAEREGEVPGTHIVKYSSEVDDIEIIHTAHSRKGFALGAVLAGEWLLGKSGTFGMDDLLGNNTS